MFGNMAISCMLLLFIVLLSQEFEHNFIGISDVFKHGIWTTLKDIKDPSLRELSGGLKSVVLASRQPATISSYNGAFSRWKRWADMFEEVVAFPAEPQYVSLYLLSLMQFSKSPSPIINAYYGISWAHSTAVGVVDPTSNMLPRLVVEAAKRQLGRETVKKDPITPDILEKIVSSSSESCLKSQRLVTMCLICYAGFLRYNEMANICRCDIKFYDSYLDLFIEKAKNDVYRDGNHVVIAKTGTVTCPYNALQRYLVLANIAPDSDEYIFRSISYFKSAGVYKLRSDPKPISYTNAREVVLQRLASIGLNPKLFGLHSFRSGAASVSANSGVSYRMFKRHGRWRSEKAKDGYVKDSLLNKLQVSLSLGI